MKNYDWVTNEMFYDKLKELVGEMHGADILAVPGVYECLKEELNNEVLSALEQEREEQENE